MELRQIRADLKWEFIRTRTEHFSNFVALGVVLKELAVKKAVRIGADKVL